MASQEDSGANVGEESGSRSSLMEVVAIANIVAGAVGASSVGEKVDSKSAVTVAETLASFTADVGAEVVTASATVEYVCFRLPWSS